MSEKTSDDTRLGRARIVRKKILELAAEHGRWAQMPLGDGQSARFWAVDAGLGWSASISTPFSGVNPYAFKPKNHAEAVLARRLPKRSEQLIDVYDATSGLKVMSLDVADGGDRLVNYTGGTWEVAFGLRIVTGRPRWRNDLPDAEARSLYVVAPTN